MAAHLLVDTDISIFATVFMSQIIGNFFLRMAAVYMLPVGSLWTRTDVVPRWLTILTFVVGLAFLLFAHGVAHVVGFLIYWRLIPEGQSWTYKTTLLGGLVDVGDAGIRAAFATPLGSPPLRELARGRDNAAILIDDLTRPTPAYRTLPYILDELNAAGIRDERVRIVCALACHRAMRREDYLKKLGADLVERVHVVNHNPHDNLEYLGMSSLGVKE